jgi:hypothetical protein
MPKQLLRTPRKTKTNSDSNQTTTEIQKLKNATCGRKHSTAENGTTTFIAESLPLLMVLPKVAYCVVGAGTGTTEDGIGWAGAVCISFSNSDVRVI